MNNFFEKIKAELIRPSNFISAVLISLVLQASIRAHYSGGIFGTFTENYIRTLEPKDIFITIAFFIVSIISLAVFSLILKGDWIKYKSNSSYNMTRVVVITTLAIAIVWTPFYLSFYPGGVYSDTTASIMFSVEGVLSNRQPFLYNMIISFFMHLGYHFNKSLTWSMGVFTAVQMVTMAIVVVYFMCWMAKKTINKSIIVICGAFLILCPLIPLYLVSIWKDTPFCISMLFWTIQIYDVCFEDEISIKTYILFAIGLFFTAFTRNNGPYIVAATVIIMCLCLDKTKHVLRIVAMLSVILIFIIQGPIYSAFGIRKNSTVENFAVPIQQISAVMAYDGAVSEEQMMEINEFFPGINFKHEYAPCIADSIKWSEGFDEFYFEAHIKQFLELWAGMMKDNFGIYVRAYLMDTLGFWDATKADPTCYVQTEIWPVNNYGITSNDYFKEIFGTSIKDILMPRQYLSSAVLCWIYFIMTVICTSQYGTKSMVLFAPQLAVWVSLLVATPIAFSFRYVAALLFTIPILILNTLGLKNQY